MYFQFSLRFCHDIQSMGEGGCVVISIHLHAYLCKINLNVLLSIRMGFSGQGLLLINMDFILVSECCNIV